MEYLHVFNSETDYNTARSNDYKEPWVSATNIGGVGSSDSYRINYDKSEYEKLLETPLTFEITSAGNIVWKANNTAYTVTLEYSKNGGEWTSITSNTGSSAPSISVSAGDSVQFRANNSRYASSDSYNNSFSGTTCGFKIKGNIMSLLNKDDFALLDTLQSSYTFNNLFKNCTSLTDASKLVLPATTLVSHCYSYMFNGCTSLTTAPSILPATTLTYYCYEYMFDYCTSLTTTPELPATNLDLADGCYGYMFRGCTSLTTTPELPATTLADACYGYMFRGCTSLTTTPELPATTLEDNCYEGMFSICTGLTTVPELPATTLKEGCYNKMFYNCTSLNYIKAMFTTTPGSSYTSNWVSGVASSGTFVKNSAATWNVTGTSGVPTGWTVQTV